ncbi:c-type cytochrome [Kordiimonas sp. SCSIO 12610]|nr:cytochrome c peroxidase [Kordiimonas sp. SCSIO 12610]UTW54771.1 c-type cytochrome [Kordiimonas sp. SCSIO 12610]
MKSFLVAILIILSSSMQSVAEDDLRALANAVFGQLPEKMPGSENDTIERIALGRKLFFETALSGNETQSCNSCHELRDGGSGTDNLRVSVGALGIEGRRNSPTVWNAGFQFVQFWDGRAENLAEQAKSPILTHHEMALPSEEIAIERLSKSAEYRQAFTAAFSDLSDPITFDTIAEALAAFQRTLVTQDRFDDFLAGDDNALNEQEKKGLYTFIKSGCNGCHNGPLMGGELFMKMGLVNPYPNTDDKGRAEVTGKRRHNYLFKVPTLRNVAQTAPYFHDGAVFELDQAVSDTGWHQLGIKFTPEETKDIVAFLKALDNTRTLDDLK